MVAKQENSNEHDFLSLYHGKKQTNVQLSAQQIVRRQWKKHTHFEGSECVNAYLPHIKCRGVECKRVQHEYMANLNGM